MANKHPDEAEAGGEMVDDYVDLDVSQPDDDHRWLVLFDEDYENVMLDQEDNVALLVDRDQAGEVLQLACTAITALTDHRDKEFIDFLIDELQDIQEGDDGQGQ